ncbi:MAG: hypothetical protein Q8O67_07980 [Deltaproteobacteria bacterium]|nr:hypothetical protein [Deltaproteobacteria bacterium]
MSEAPGQASINADDVALVIRARREQRPRALAGCVASVVFAVAVVAVLVAVAVPNFVKFGCRSKQSEAKSNLKALYIAEQSYRGERDAFTASFADLGFTPQGYKLRYRYVVGDVDGDRAFTAFAISTEQTFEGDVWSIDDKGELSHLEDACR